MAYNNGFPMNYPQYYPQYPQQQTQPQNQNYSQPQNQNSNSGIIWVLGEAGAKSYLVAPNTTVQLWDSENPIIYLKSADASGMPSMKILDYKIREQSQPQNTSIVEQPITSMDFVTHEELNDFEKKIIRKIDELNKEEEIGA